MYYEYWGMTRPPFDNVPDPTMYFDLHRSVENAVAETLFAIEEGNECLAVIVGEVGLGKTMALRIILDSLDSSKYNVAFVTNPDLTFVQLLREIVGQLRGEPCTIATKEALLEEFNKILFETKDRGAKVVILMDEANALRPKNLESLRLLTNMQDDRDNLFTMVLAGQPELAKRLEHPRRANLFQRIGVYCKLERLDSIETLRDYVEHRMEVASCTRRIFTDDAYEAIWEASDHGVPRLVNKICKLALKAGETNGLDEVDRELVERVAATFAPLTRKKAEGRKTGRKPKAEPELASSLEPAPPAASGDSSGGPAVVVPEDLVMRSYCSGTRGAEGAGEASPAETPAAVGAGREARPTPATPEERMKLAGRLAAQRIHRNPELYRGQDIVKVWIELRDEIARSL